MNQTLKQGSRLKKPPRTFDTRLSPRLVLSTAEAAEILEIGADRVRTLIHSGKLPAIALPIDRPNFFIVRKRDVLRLRKREGIQ